MADKQIPLGRTAVYGLLPEADVQKIIDDDLREILATHRPEPLSEPVRKEIRAILGRFEGA